MPPPPPPPNMGYGAPSDTAQDTTDVVPLLEVVEGNDRGRFFELPWAEAMVGRGTQCDFVLADLAVSRKHVLISFDGSGFVLIDQGSGNGTKVNGVRVARHGLVDGDIIQLGKTKLVFRWPEARPLPAEQPVLVAEQYPPPAPVPTAAPGPAPAARPAPAPRPAPAARPAPAPGLAAPARPAPAPRPAPAARPAPAPRPAPAARPAPAPRPAPAARPPRPVGPGAATERVDPRPAGIVPQPDISPPTGLVAPARRRGFTGFLGRLTDTRGKKIVVFLGLFLILALLTLAMIAKLKGPRKRRARVVQKSNQLDLQALYEQALALVHQKKWSAAEVLLLKMAVADPHNAVIQAKLDEVRKNKEAEVNLKKARQTLASGDPTGAEVLAKLVGKGTLYYEAAQNLIHAARKQRVDRLLKEAAPLAADKKFQAMARAKVDKAIALLPDYRPALVLRHKLGGPPPPPEAPPPDQGQQTDTQPDQGSKVADKGPVATRESRPASPRTPVHRMGRSSSRAGTAPTNAAFRAFYKARNWSAAAAELRRLAASQRGARARRTSALASKVKRMGAAFQRAEANKSRNSMAAMNAYLKALSLDRSISRGLHGAYIKSQLGKVARAAAGSALSSGRYQQAYRAATVAKRYGGNSAAVQRIMSQLEQKARGVFNKGYVVKDSNLNKARSYWRQVTRMVPPGSTWYKKAQWFLKNYGKSKSRNSSDDEL